VCTACGSGHVEQAFVAGDWYLGSTPGPVWYSRCGQCGTVFAAPQPDDDTLARAYASTYGPHSRPSLVERLGEPLARREAERLLALSNPSRLLLDLGCGRGTFLRRMRRAGWTGPMLGLEPAKEVAQQTSRELGIPVEVGNLEDVDLEANSAGTVVLRHVLEHLRDPRSTLVRIAGILERGGSLYLATPDARALAASLFGRFWHGYDPPRHLFAFTSNGVRRLLESTGFEVVEESWRFSPQMWTGSLRHALSRGKSRRWASLLGHDLNPIVAVPAVAAAGLEVALHRSTMYAVVATRAGRG
jgi:SAM-dependent methyltransferase